MSTATLDRSPLTAQDRCDADCSAQAYVRVSLPVGAPLLFCGHHYRKNATVIDALGGAVVEDFTDFIHDGKPGASA